MLIGMVPEYGSCAGLLGSLMVGEIKQAQEDDGYQRIDADDLGPGRDGKEGNGQMEEIEQQALGQDEELLQERGYRPQYDKSLPGGQRTAFEQCVR